MEDNNQLNYSWLGGLSNANHDGTTQQIDDTAANFETENQKYNQMAAAVHQARVHEDEVWQKSLVDPVVKQLEAADKQQDCYMTAFRYINDGYASLPDTEAQKQDALAVQQVFKDFKFRVNDGYGAEADKILQMGQNLQPKQEFLTQIGAWQWYVKAAQKASLVRQLLTQRAQTKGEFVKGELKAARRQTDLAIADLYRVINAMNDLMPSAELTALITQLKGFERCAREYLLPKGKGGDEPEPEPTPDPSPEPEPTPVEPEQ